MTMPESDFTAEEWNLFFTGWLRGLISQHSDDAHVVNKGRDRLRISVYGQNFELSVQHMGSSGAEMRAIIEKHFKQPPAS